MRRLPYVRVAAKGSVGMAGTNVIRDCDSSDTNPNIKLGIYNNFDKCSPKHSRVGCVCKYALWV